MDSKSLKEKRVKHSLVSKAEPHCGDHEKLVRVKGWGWGGNGGRKGHCDNFISTILLRVCRDIFWMNLES